MRRCLHSHLQQVHGLPPRAIIVDELGLCQGSVRVDVAVVNERLHGYEIKTDRDSLERLRHQAHLHRALSVLPAWWGIGVAGVTRESVCIDWYRLPEPNPDVEPAALAQLLWRDEVMGCLIQLGLAEGLRSKPRSALWASLVEALSLDELSSVVRSAIKARGDWRSRGSGNSV